VLAAIRRARYAIWAAGLRARLRRHGVALDLRVGRNLRLAGRPRLELDPEGTRGGRLAIRVGDGVRIGRDLVLDVRAGGDHLLELGHGCDLEDHVRLQLRGGAIRAADHVQLRDLCELKSAGELVLGSRAICGRATTLHCARRVELGPRVGLAERVTITDSDHDADGSDTWFMAQPIVVEPVRLEDNAFVATNGVVLRGSTIGRNSVVAAGAVVAGGVHEPGVLLGGVPARTLKRLGA
jgi:acetyltransferase-like isoleucine patch superfamily enzyme